MTKLSELKKLYPAGIRSAQHRRTSYLKAELKAMKSLRSKGILLGSDNMIRVYTWILKQRGQK
jgi:hypothetical protein